MRAAVAGAAQARDWIKTQGRAAKLAEQAMLVANELHTTMKGYVEWHAHAQRYEKKLKAAPPAGVSPFVELDDTLFDYTPGTGALRILGYGTYRVPIPGEKTVDVAFMGLNRRFAEELRRDHVPSLELSGDPYSYASIAAADLTLHNQMTRLLEGLCGEQVTSTEKPTAEAMALMIIEFACRALNLKRPSDAELFVIGIATHLEDPLTDEVLRRSVIADAARFDPAEALEPDDINEALSNQQATELERGADRWKHRRQAAEKRVNSLLRQ